MRRCSIAPALLIASSLVASPRVARSEPEPGKIDPALLPLVGGDTDFGLGIGLMGSIAKLGDPVTTNVWKLQFTAIQTFKLDSENDITSPYQDYILKFTRYDFPVRRGRLELYANYTHSRLYYPGLGNASGADLNADGNRYERTSALFQATMRSPITKRLFHESGIGFTHNMADYAADSRIALEQSSPDPVVRKGALLPKTHGVPMFVQAVGWDSRDADVATSRGMWHRVAVRVAPGGTPYMATPYMGFSGQFRGYHTVIRDRWVIAWRVVGDVLLGDAPTYELGRHEMGWAIGGTDGLRGVPAQRYYGAVKGFATLEQRVWIFRFRAFGQSMRFGAAGFGDVGRVFATTTERPDLDGSGHGIKYGVGGGPRLGQGKAFEARLDVAYSPDARPVGIYVGAGQAF